VDRPEWLRRCRYVHPGVGTGQLKQDHLAGIVTMRLLMLANQMHKIDKFAIAGENMIDEHIIVGMWDCAVWLA
jgi:hypothetical protein